MMSEYLISAATARKIVTVVEGNRRGMGGALGMNIYPHQQWLDDMRTAHLT